MTSEKLYQYEIILLSLLVLVLPSLEALKTFFWFSYLCVYLLRRFRNGHLSLLPSQQINIAITLFLLAAFSSTIANWPFDNGFKGFIDELRYCTLFFCLYNGGYTAREYRRIALLIILGVLGGLLYGLVEFLLQMRPELQFHSAGILTQSSIYLGIAIILTTGLLLDDQGGFNRYKKFLLVAWFIQVFTLIYMGSRGSMLAVAAILFIIALIKCRIRTVLLFIGVTAVMITIAGSLLKVYPDNPFSKEIKRQYSVERIKHADKERVQLWNLSVAKLRTAEDLVWGVGPRNYKSIQNDEFVTQSESLSKINNFHHAHNLFLTQLIEQGFIGLLAMLYFYFLVLLKILNLWHTDARRSPAWYWYAGLGGFAIPLVAGLFNTPFYQEHAMLAMLLMGTMFARPENRGNEQKPLHMTEINDNK